jgi:hypothetical protein
MDVLYWGEDKVAADWALPVPCLPCESDHNQYLSTSTDLMKKMFPSRGPWNRSLDLCTLIVKPNKGPRATLALRTVLWLVHKQEEQEEKLDLYFNFFRKFKKQCN